MRGGRLLPCPARRHPCQHERGGIGFGVGLNEYESGSTFSATFDDIAVYSLVDYVLKRRLRV